MNLTPYVTGAGSFKRPFERYYDDPVYDVHDADDDGQIDNPGNVLYYMPTRTNQTDSYNLSLGVSATWSRPLDKKLQALCKAAAQTNIEAMAQATANKRLDFEIARLKNCGELMKAGIMFHPKSPYASVCADVVVTNPGGTIKPHTHDFPTPEFTDPSTSPSGSEQPLQPGSSLSEQEVVPVEIEPSPSSQESSELSPSPSLSQVSLPSGADLLGVWQVGHSLLPR